MNRRNLLKAAAGVAPGVLRGAQNPGRPNIIYLHTHDTGRYIQPYGHAVPTPNLQKFAEEAVLFRQAFDAAPTCSPSRAALLTGRSPHSCGMYGLVNRGFRLADPKLHLAHFLRSQGYETVLSGLQHEAPYSEVPGLGYEKVLLKKGNRAAEASRAAAEYLDARPKQPFFLACGYFETHREFPEAGPGDDPRYTLPPAPLPDTARIREDMARFKTMAREMDAGMGAVLRAVERNGLAANTLIIITTDHGIAFPAMKCNLSQHGMGVMLLMRGPGGFSGGKVTGTLVSHIDLFPTLCDVAGLKHPDGLEGHSLMPFMRGERAGVRERLFGEVSYHASYQPMRCVRTPRYNYVRRWGGRTAPVLPNCDDGPSKTEWLEHGWRDQPQPAEALYDLTFDPNETHNLIGEPRLRATAEGLKRELDKWMRETRDPLLQGDVPAPKGAQVNNPDATSPREPVLVLD